MTFTTETGTVTPQDDLYRDVHKGIRAELFSVTLEAGRSDPYDDAARAAVAAHVDSVADFLVGHAGHEDAHVQPVLERSLPALAAQVAADHALIDGTLADLRAAASDAVEAGPGRSRASLHRLHLDLAAFTARYLEHEELEERVVMPALVGAVGSEGARALHGALVASIPPAEMAAGLAVMLPAMNLDDRAELLGGVRAGGGPDAFAGVWALARAVLEPVDAGALASRLGV